MALDPPSIFEGGRLNPGVYKIQNIYTETFLDIEVHSREVCCRPAHDLGEGRGIWEIKCLGAGYSVQRFAPGEPEEFCTPLDGPQNSTVLQVGAYPVAWRIEIVDDDRHRRFGFVCFYWATKQVRIDLNAGCKDNGAKVVTYQVTKCPWQIWKLIPVTVGVPSTPPRAQHVEYERDEFGTIVNEVTVVTTTVTTRKRYRVEDP